jgi:hypothetical protein
VAIPEITEVTPGGQEKLASLVPLHRNVLMFTIFPYLYL